MTPREIQAALAEPFPAEALGWLPQSITGNRCLALPYIDARDVMIRLDAVVGIEGWRDAYEVQADGNVQCTLSIRVGKAWIAKADVGGPSDQKDTGDKRKAAYSDALKRAAVKWGIGRYIYALPKTLAGYDPAKKEIIGTPKLPHWALPKAATTQPGPAADPASRRIAATDKACAAEGLCEPGELIAAHAEALSRGPVDAAPWVAAWKADMASRLPITPEQLAALDAELDRTGESWQRCQAKLSLPRGVQKAGILRGQAAALLDMLKDVDNRVTS